MNLILRNSMLDFDSLFNDCSHGPGSPALGTKLPDSVAKVRADAHEGEHNFEIHAGLTGVKEKDFNITLRNNVQTTCTSKNTESEKNRKVKVTWKKSRSGSL